MKCKECGGDRNCSCASPSNPKLEFTQTHQTHRGDLFADPQSIKRFYFELRALYYCCYLMPWERRKSREECIFRHLQDRFMSLVGTAVTRPAHKTGDERGRMQQHRSPVCAAVWHCRLPRKPPLPKAISTWREYRNVYYLYIIIFYIIYLFIAV